MKAWKEERHGGNYRCRVTASPLNRGGRSLITPGGGDVRALWPRWYKNTHLRFPAQLPPLSTVHGRPAHDLPTTVAPPHCAPPT